MQGEAIAVSRRGAFLFGVIVGAASFMAGMLAARSVMP